MNYNEIEFHEIQPEDVKLFIAVAHLLCNSDYYSESLSSINVDCYLLNNSAWYLKFNTDQKLTHVAKVELEYEQ